MAYEKLLNEIYAALSLKYLWKDYKPSFIKSESPDWINKNMNMGLEVSQALFPNDGKESCIIEQYLGMPKDEIPPDTIAFYGDRLHFYNGRFWAILPEKDSYQDYLFKARFRFDRKLEKLNSNYKNYTYNGLYLFLHPDKDTSINPDPLFKYMKDCQKDKSKHFDWVFLNCTKEIHVCDFRKDIIETIILPENAEDFLTTESEYLRYCRNWINGTIC